MRTPAAPGHCALRRGRWSQPGGVYLVTTATAGRRPVFARFDRAREACLAFDAFEREGAASLLAWVLMPNHAHWLVQLGPREPLHQAINRLKSSSARRVLSRFGGSRPLWSRGFHDRAMRHGDDLIAASRYIIANPLRAGLVRRIVDYPFWNAIYL